MDSHTCLTVTCELWCLDDVWSCRHGIFFISSVRFRMRYIEQIPMRESLPEEMNGITVLR